MHSTKTPMSIGMERRTFLKTTAGLAGAAAVPSGWAQDKVTRIVLPFPAGGLNDVILRQLSITMAEALGRNIIVENRAGAAGLIGTRAVQHAPADGSTLLFHYIGLLGLPYTQKNANYDGMHDFSPIAMVADGPAYILVNSNVPARTFDEFLGWAKTVKGGVESATSGPGGGSHMWTLLLAKQAGIDLLPVPYKGGAEQSMALIQGDAKVMISNMSESLNAQVKTGKVRILAVASDQPMSITPDVPLAKDVVPGFVIAGWSGLFAPAATPASEIETISAAVRKAVAEPAYRQKCASLYLEAKYQGPAEFAKTMVETNAFWKRVVTELNISPQ